MQAKKCENLDNFCINLRTNFCQKFFKKSNKKLNIFAKFLPRNEIAIVLCKLQMCDCAFVSNQSADPRLVDQIPNNAVKDFFFCEMFWVLKNNFFLWDVLSLQKIIIIINLHGGVLAAGCQCEGVRGEGQAVHPGPMARKHGAHNCVQKSSIYEKLWRPLKICEP